MAGIGTLTVTVTSQIKWNAQNPLVGSDYQPLQNVGNIQPTFSYTTATANNLEGGADELVSYIINIAISSNTTIDLTNLTNILQQAGISLARVKYYLFRLLSVADDAVYGTLCTSVTVGNAGSNAQQFNLGSGSTANINNGGEMSYWDESAGGFVVSSGAKNVKIVNNDSTSGGSGPTSHVAAIQMSLIGGST